MGVMEGGAKRRHRSKQERRAIVEETLKPGASVSRIARAYDVNANQVFAWRRQYREGRLDLPPGSKALVPVKIADALERLKPSTQPKATRTGIIDIDLGHARIRIEGAADPDCVRAAVEGVIR